MNRPKWVAVLSGVLALIVSIGYLLLVQLLDFRGEFKPAPIGTIANGTVAVVNSEFRPSGWVT
ncbi:hypothetical protein [Synechococcus sp. PCC 7336]|uniref:hypothetical protein n=1 Tax=Synechococcus sp. PCC 7336 TaxID=195250 RepID=UPI00034533A8|nr:hypothetical protein [Synechococcus sp. PCC 7336]